MTVTLPRGPVVIHSECVIFTFFSVILVGSAGVEEAEHRL